MLLRELASLRFSGPSAGSLSSSLRAASKLAALKQSMLLFLSFAEPSNASKPIFRSGNGRSAESLILRKLLRQNSLPPDSYELTAAGPPLERCEKLERGLLAATMVTQPFDLKLEERGFHALASSREIVPHYPFTVGVVREEDRINEGILAFLKCVKMAWQWLADPTHRSEASAILSNYTKAGEKQAQRTYDLYLNPPTPPSLALDEKGVTTILELLAEGGRIQAPIAPAQKYIDRRYLNRLEQY